MTEAVLPKEHCRRLGRINVMSMAWATVDLARTAPLPHSLIVADEALHNGADLAAVLPHMRFWTGTDRARWVIEHANPAAESALETLGGSDSSSTSFPFPSRTPGWATTGPANGWMASCPGIGGRSKATEP
jgi:hypothetical protein